MMVGLCGTCYVTGNGNPSLETSWSIRRLDLDIVTDGPLYAQQRAPQEAQEAKQKSETSAQWLHLHIPWHCKFSLVQKSHNMPTKHEN